MLIAHVTDTHIPHAFRRRVDTRPRLRAAVDCIAAMRPLPDVLIATGDLVEAGAPDEYRALTEILAPLPMPVLPIPGNHDARGPLAAAFPDIARKLDGRFFQYVVDDYPLRLVALDTLDEGCVGGRLCAERLAWVADVLAQSSRPTLLFMHHPPYDYGAVPNADMHCANADALAAIVRKHPAVVGVVCGHLHRSTMQRWAGTIAYTVPATAPALQMMVDGHNPEGWVETPPMVGLHLWRADAGLVSHVVAADEAARFTPFV
jgi:3',5'-cyclic AMP phosphodiesterase CpdA